jgi:tetratricopeptide (TPR) repeat protein
MDKELMRKIIGFGKTFFRQAWLNIVLILLGISAVGAGVYLKTKPELTSRSDIEEYNLGVSAYEDQASSQLGKSIDEAKAQFEKALVASSDDGLRALALYNIGTVRGIRAWESIERIRQSYGPGGIPESGEDEALMLVRMEIREAVKVLAEAIRIDPNDEAAKFNLELLESQLGGPPVSGSRFSPGEIEKGY